MKLKILFLICALVSANLLFSQTYSSGDVDILKAIAAECDKTGTLNWLTEPDPGLWTEVGWDGNTPKRVKWLALYEKSLTGVLNVSGLNNLTTVLCQNNQLTGLNLSGLPNLEYVMCADNLLTNIVISSVNNLQRLYCYENNLTALDISELTNLQVLNCGFNLLTTLDITQNTQLEQLLFSNNELTETDLSSLIKLTDLEYLNNRLPFSSLATGLQVSSNYTFYQNTIFMPDQTFVNDVTIDYSSEALINGISTTFKFYKDGVPVETNITGLYTTTGEGEYFCDMTNSLFPNTVLRTAKSIVEIKRLEVSKTTVDIDATGAAAYLSITSNTDWGISEIPSWLTISKTSGFGNETDLQFTASSNGTSPRSAIITISATGVSPVYVTVNQAASKYLSVSLQSLQLASDSGSTTTFDLNSNVNWNIEIIPSGWTIISDTTGSGDATLQVTAASANVSSDDRIATISVTGTGVYPQTITLTQVAFGTTLNLTLSKSSMNIGASANSTGTFDVTSNVSWIANSSETWLTLSVASGYGDTSITLLATANPGGSSRVSTVTVSGAGITQTVAVTQNGKNTVSFNETANEISRVYPNPCTDKLNIKLSSQLLPALVSIYSVDGEKIAQLEVTDFETELNMADREPGIYVLQIITSDQSFVERIIKQ